MVLLKKRIDFLTFSLPSASLDLKVRIDIGADSQTLLTEVKSLKSATQAMF